MERQVARHATELHGVTIAPKPEVVPEAIETPEVAEMPAAPRRRSGSWTAWSLSMVSMGVLVGLVVIGFIRFLDGPVQGQALAATPTPPTRIEAAANGTSLLGGDYFEMTYPAMFDQMGQQKKDPQVLEEYMLSSKNDPRRSIAVSVRPAATLDDDSSYKFRQIHPESYKMRLDKIGPESVTVMLKDDNSEATLFWIHQGKLLTVSVTSSNPADAVADILAGIEPKLRWRV